MVKIVIRLSIVSAMLCVVAVACKNRKTEAIQIEDFEEFYQKFISDEDFQLSRIEFPLDGCETDSDTTIYWNSPNDWTLISDSIYDIDATEYKVEKDYSPTKVVLKIYIEDSGFGITQEYELEDGKWYLTMYDSMSN